MKKTKRMSLKRAAVAFLSAGMMLTMPMYAAPLLFTAFADGEAQYVQGDTMTYYKYDDHVEIYNCSSNQTSFEIPETIEGLPVTAIAMYGFQCSNTFFYAENLTSLDIRSVTEIGSMALCGCNKLTDLKLSNKLTKIDSYAFSDNTSTCTITFYGTEEEWNKVGKPSDSEFLKKAKIIFADAPEEPEEVIGDVNMDGKFDANDIVLVQKWILTIPGTTMKDPKAADFTKDDVIDIYDLGLMKHELLKKS